MEKNINKLCQKMINNKDIIKSLYFIYPNIFNNYIDNNYENILFIESSSFIANNDYQIFNLLKLNDDVFTSFYISNMFKKNLKIEYQILILNTFFKFNFFKNKTLIICIITKNLQQYFFNYIINEFDNVKLIIIILPNINYISEIFFQNQIFNIDFNKNKLIIHNEIKHLFTDVNYFFLNLIIEINNEEIKTHIEHSNIDDIIILYYNKKNVDVSKNIIKYYIINIINNNEKYNIEKYIIFQKINNVNFNFQNDKYILNCDINDDFNNINHNYLNKYYIHKKLFFIKNIYSKNNNSFFFDFNNVLHNFIKKYDNMKNFNLIMCNPNLLNYKSANSIIYENYIKCDNEIFTFLYKIKIKTTIRNIDNIFYEFSCFSFINNLKKFFPNFPFVFYYFVHDNFQSNYYNSIVKIIDSSNNNHLDFHHTQNIFLNKLNIDMIYTEDDISGFAIEKITNSMDSISLIDMLLNQNIIIKNKNKTINNMLNYDLWTLFFQIYIVLNKFKQNFTHNDLHIDNIIYKIIPNNQYIQINYYENYSSKKKLITLYTKYIPVFLDFGKCFIKTDTFNSKIDLLDKLNIEHDNNNINITQDLRYFTLIMDYLINKMNEHKITKKNLLIYKYLKKYKLEGWMTKNNKYLFLTKILFQKNNYYVKECPTKKNTINNVESLYNYLFNFHNIYINKNKKIINNINNIKNKIYGFIDIDVAAITPWIFTQK